MKNFLSSASNAIWTFAFIPLLLICGILITYYTRFIQLRKLGAALLLPFRKGNENAGRRSTLRAASTALASTIGTGNIVGTAQAICMGGPGSLFWMWITATLGMAVKYAEIALTAYYHTDGPAPMNYISRAIGPRAAGLYAFAAALSGLGMGCMTQISSITDAVANLRFISPFISHRLAFRLFLGLLTASVTALCLRFGRDGIGAVSQVLVPFMSIVFLFSTFAVVFVHYRSLPSVFSSIIKDAFSFRAVGGALSGSCIVNGVRRGAFSNEAGLGSAALAHSEADSTDPAEQGLWGIFEVFADTMLICTATGLAILTASCPPGSIGTSGSTLLQNAVAEVLGADLSCVIVSGTLCLFAYTTLMTWALYGTCCTAYFLGEAYAGIYTYIYLAAIPVSCVMSTSVVWNIADLCNALMSLPNLAALIVNAKHLGKISTNISS